MSQIDEALLNQLRELARRGDGTVCLAFDTVHCDGDAIVLPTVYAQSFSDRETGPTFVRKIQDLTRDRKDLVIALRAAVGSIKGEGRFTGDLDALLERFKDV